MRIESQRDIAKVMERAKKDSGADEQQHGEGDLKDQQQFGGVEPRAMRAQPYAVEDGRQICRGRAERRKQAEQHRRGERGGGADRKKTPAQRKIDSHLTSRRRQHRQQRAAAP